jgi:cell wall-associated NlpC family hydrolase
VSEQPGLLRVPDALGVDTELEPAGAGIDGIDQMDFDTRIPVASYEQFKSTLSDGTTTPGGFGSGLANTISGAAESGVRGDVVKYAKKFLGMQYHWGGTNPNTSFDCSGFTQYVLGKFGVHIPRISYQQANYGSHVSLNKLQAGDLVAWDNSSRNNGADHVALYIGNGQIMEFYRTGKPSRIRKLGHNEGAIGVHINYKE